MNMNTCRKTLILSRSKSQKMRKKRLKTVIKTNQRSSWTKTNLKGDLEELVWPRQLMLSQNRSKRRKKTRRLISRKGMKTHGFQKLLRPSTKSSRKRRKRKRKKNQRRRLPRLTKQLWEQRDHQWMTLCTWNCKVMWKEYLLVGSIFCSLQWLDGACRTHSLMD